MKNSHKLGYKAFNEMLANATIPLLKNENARTTVSLVHLLQMHKLMRECQRFQKEAKLLEILTFRPMIDAGTKAFLALRNNRFTEQVLDEEASRIGRNGMPEENRDKTEERRIRQWQSKKLTKVRRRFGLEEYYEEGCVHTHSSPSSVWTGAGINESHPCLIVGLKCLEEILKELERSGEEMSQAWKQSYRDWAVTTRNETPTPPRENPERKRDTLEEEVGKRFIKELEARMK
jgi:hypothetical protein